MHLENYLEHLRKAETNLAQGFRETGEGHQEKVDIFHAADTLSRQCEAYAEKLAPFCEKYGKEASTEPDRLYDELFRGTRSGGLGLLRDLQDLYVMASACDISWTMIGQAAQGARDEDLLAVVEDCEGQTANQLRWLTTRMTQAAPQALLVAS
jgi:hypothetical protein